MSSTSFDTLGRYVISDYAEKRPFSSFLPGIAGHMGVPMWVFYINRGQGIASFGIESKDHPLMEFQPANRAYQLTPYMGFRTFIKWTRGDQSGFYEPFSPLNIPHGVQRNMLIGMSELEICDENPSLGLTTQVLYFTLPHEPFAALARQVKFTNTGNRPLEIEVLDGMPALIPYGINNQGLKEVSRTLEAWMKVFHLESGLPFFRLRATPDDTSEVSAIQAGHFALGFVSQDDETKLLSPFVDPNIVFSANTSLSTPDFFLQHPLETLHNARQVTTGRTPCALFGHASKLAPGESVTMHTLFGHVNGFENIRQARSRFSSPSYFVEKRLENQALVRSLTDVVDTHTGISLFNAYVRQTFLDNVLRGGWPILLGDEGDPHIYHIYSRKHGDLERDYNHFFLSAEFYSQGNGNFRDVIQNRRCDVLLEPRVGDHNIRTFLSLIQPDGYNPLVIQGTSFSLVPDRQAELLELADSPERLTPILENHFTPGELLKHIVDHQIGLDVSYSEFINRALAGAQQHLEANFGEGYWIDHWPYILDLIENYLAVYPERKYELLFGAKVLPFYDSAVFVRPRTQKYVLTEKGPRQYEAVAFDEEKAALIAARPSMQNWVRTDHGQGEIYRTTAFAKLFILATIKFATMDPWGMGIEMEAGKPGWYDALNGLPGLFGSSLAETYELQRLIQFLLKAIAENEDVIINLPVEINELMLQMENQLLIYTDSSGASRDHYYWHAVSEAQEEYRERVHRGFDGAEKLLPVSILADSLTLFLEKIRQGVTRALGLNEGVPPTYFAYEVDDYEVIRAPNGDPTLDAQGRPFIHAKGFKAVVLPLFLEGFVRAMKVIPQRKESQELYEYVRASALFDRKLKMYKVNASLEDQPHEIGRARAFTPGWLENESIWLHMEYKYLLEVLKAGLYEEFYEDYRDALIPFLDPDRYGRNPLENSSFIVSSAHPDESLHGAGFVARMSGATAEFIHIWSLMMVGRQPFQVSDSELLLRLRPALLSWLFDEHNQVRFNFLGSIPVTYHNPQRVDTWNLLPEKISIRLPDGQSLDFHGPDIPSPYVYMVRNKEVESIDVYFEK